MRQSLLQLIIGSLVCVGCAYPLKPDYDSPTISVPEEAQCSFSATYREDQNCCAMRAYRTAIDVDTAYDRLVREFGFNRVPQPYEVEGEAYPEIYHGHRHETRHGGPYELWGIVVPRGDVRLFRGVWMGFTLRATGPDSTDVRPVYCEVQARPMKQQLVWHRAVQRSIRATLPPDAR